jgi:hypothetical protein
MDLKFNTKIYMSIDHIEIANVYTKNILRTITISKKSKNG